MDELKESNGDGGQKPKDREAPRGRLEEESHSTQAQQQVRAVVFPPSILGCIEGFYAELIRLAFFKAHGQQCRKK